MPGKPVMCAFMMPSSYMIFSIEDRQPKIAKDRAFDAPCAVRRHAARIEAKRSATDSAARAIMHFFPSSFLALSVTCHGDHQVRPVHTTLLRVCPRPSAADAQTPTSAIMDHGVGYVGGACTTAGIASQSSVEVRWRACSSHMICSAPNLLPSIFSLFAGPEGEGGAQLDIRGMETRISSAERLFR